MRRYFTAGEVVRLTGVTYRRLDLWCRREIIQPSMRTARGRGQRRLFTFRDLVEIRTIKTLTAQGVRLAALLVAVNRIRRDFGDLDGSPLASARLVTDGRSVFRYVPARDHLERLDEYGQFAFAFDLGAEVAALRGLISQLDGRSRYTRRLTAEITDDVQFETQTNSKGGGL